MKHVGENVVRIEAEALRALADRIAGPMAGAFDKAVELIFACGGRVVVTGMGKSGIIARKIAATLSSTGTPALFMHPVDAVHGDLGMVVRGDLVLALSASGETEEILRLAGDDKAAAGSVDQHDWGCGVETLRKRRGRVARDHTDRVMHRLSTLAAAADVALDCSVAKEACGLGLAPTASTTAMLALGDALAMALSEKRGFQGRRFRQSSSWRKTGEATGPGGIADAFGRRRARVTPQTKMPDVIYEMSRKKLGVTAVVEGKKLVGVISDGDLRRLLEKRGKDVLDLTAAECMTAQPRTIGANEFAATALALMEEKKITSLAVIDDERVLLGIVHLHDLWGTEMM